MVDGVIDELVAAPLPTPSAIKSKLKRKPGEIAGWRLLLFSSPGIPLMGGVVPVAFLLPPFYTGELGMSLTTFGLVMLIGRLVDTVIDPMIGVLCDRYGSRWGRRRHWVAIGAPLLMLGAVLLYRPQLFTQHPTAIFATVANVLFFLGYTVFSLNHTAWGGELSDDYHERTRIMGWRGMMDAAGPIVVLVAVAVLEHLHKGASNGEKVGVVTAFLMIMIPLTTVLALLTVGERRSAAPPRPTAPVNLWSGIRMVVANPVLLRLLLALLLNLAPMAVMMSVNVFFVTFVLKAPGIAASLLIIPFCCSLLSVPIWMRIAKGREKHKVLAVSYVLTAIVMSGFLFLGPGDVTAFVVLTMLSGLSTGTLFLIRSILTDVVDTDLAKGGEQRTGLFFAVLETAMKMGPMIIMAAVFPVLQAFGFDPTGHHNTAQSIAVVRYAYALAPSVPVLLAAVIMWRFPLGSKEIAALREQIRAQAAPAAE